MNQNILDIPLSLATGRLKQVLVLLAETYHETDWRPCLDRDTTLRDWLEVLPEPPTDTGKVSINPKQENAMLTVNKNLLATVQKAALEKSGWWYDWIRDGMFGRGFGWVKGSNRTNDLLCNLNMTGAIYYQCREDAKKRK